MQTVMDESELSCYTANVNESKDGSKQASKFPEKPLCRDVTFTSTGASTGNRGPLTRCDTEHKGSWDHRKALLIQTLYLFILSR